MDTSPQGKARRNSSSTFDPRVNIFPELRAEVCNTSAFGRGEDRGGAGGGIRGDRPANPDTGAGAYRGVGNEAWAFPVPFRVFLLKCRGRCRCRALNRWPVLCRNLRACSKLRVATPPVGACSQSRSSETSYSLLLLKVHFCKNKLLGIELVPVVLSCCCSFQLKNEHVLIKKVG